MEDVATITRITPAEQVSHPDLCLINFSQINVERLQNIFSLIKTIEYLVRPGYFSLTNPKIIGVGLHVWQGERARV